MFYLKRKKKTEQNRKIFGVKPTWALECSSPHTSSAVWLIWMKILTSVLRVACRHSDEYLNIWRLISFSQQPYEVVISALKTFKLRFNELNQVFSKSRFKAHSISFQNLSCYPNPTPELLSQTSLLSHQSVLVLLISTSTKFSYFPILSPSGACEQKLRIFKL